MQTLKIAEYKGYKIYIRHLGQELFEYLIPEGHRVYQQSFEINRPKGKKRSRYSTEDFAKTAEMMTEVAQEFLDATLYKRSLKYKVNNIKDTCQQKAEKLITKILIGKRITT